MRVVSIQSIECAIRFDALLFGKEESFREIGILKEAKASGVAEPPQPPDPPVRKKRKKRK